MIDGVLFSSRISYWTIVIAIKARARPKVGRNRANYDLPVNKSGLISSTILKRQASNEFFSVHFVNELPMMTQLLNYSQRPFDK